MSNFYKNLDLKYTEIGILMEDSIMEFDSISGKWIKEKAKIAIPILMSEMYSDEAIDIFNYDTGAKISTSNYLEINIPNYLYPNPLYKLEPINDNPGSSSIRLGSEPNISYKMPNSVMLKKGTKLLVTFTEGDLNFRNIKVIGLYDDDNEEE